MINLKFTAILDRTTFLVTVGSRSEIILVYKVIDLLDRCKAWVQHQSKSDTK